MTDTSEQERRERDRKARDEELRRIPLQEIDPRKWPSDVRQIALSEVGGLGIDRTGRLYWNGRPVDVTGQRLDLTWPQFWVAIALAVFTLLAAAAGMFQAVLAYDDWSCKVKPAQTGCPPPPPPAPPNPALGPS